MKTFPLFGGLAALAMLPAFLGPAVFAQDSTDKLLAGYRDKNRVLLVFAPDKKDAAFQEQRKLWQGEQAGFADRDLVVAPVLKEGTRTGRYAAEVRSFRVVLIGKDGHEAYRSDQPVTAEALYRRIDAMPMRRDEVRRRRRNGPVGNQEKGSPGAAAPEI